MEALTAILKNGAQRLYELEIKKETKNRQNTEESAGVLKRSLPFSLGYNHSPNTGVNAQ